MSPLTNWAGNLTLQPARYRRPTSLDELQHIVAESRSLRVLGSGHSFNDIVATDGDLVSLANLPSSIHLDSTACTVTVSGSLTYAELGERLHELGYGLPALASLPHISVAGACATATHGSGEGIRNLAAAVAGLEIVTETGDVAAFDRGTAGWNGTVVNLGALGVVVKVTLDVVPTFDIYQYVYENLAFDDALHHFEEIFASAYSVSLFTDWSGAGFKQLWLKHRLDDEVRPPSKDLFGATPADGPRHPATGASPRAAHCTDQMGVPGPWHERLPHFRPGFTPSSGAELQSEYLVPQDAANEALRAIDSIREVVAPVLQICEVRTIAADDLWLSPCYQRDAVGIHFTWILDSAAVLPVVGRIEEVLATFGAIPHWGKVFTTPTKVMGSIFPRLNDFQKLAAERDPTGKFRNAFVNRLFSATAT